MPDISREETLEHFGVKGMKWGIRKDVHPDIADVPKGTRKAAARDAEEHTRAAMFFGEGAGTRRKLIKARVEARKQKDPLYAKAFDHFVKQTNMDKRASQARKERRRKDNAKVAGRLLKDILGDPSVTYHAQNIHRGAINDQLAEYRRMNARSRPTGRARHSADELIDDILEHHGVKGMRWGVIRKNLSPGRQAARMRKPTVTESVVRKVQGKPQNVTRADIRRERAIARRERKAARKERKIDKKWEDERSTVKAAVAIHNRSADHFNAKIGAYNEKWKDIDISDEHSEARKKYDQGAIRLMHETYAQAHNELYGMSPSGKRKIHMYVDAEGNSRIAYGETAEVNLALDQMGIKHEVASPVVFATIVRDDKGLIVKLQPDSNPLVQTGMSFVEDILEHHGVKGMKWGVRRDNLGAAASGARMAARRKAGLAGPQGVKIKDKRKKIKTSGGQGHPAHEDAIAARTIGQRGKASGLKSLSNRELEQYAKRLQLEANVNRLNYGEKGAASKFVADLLNKNGKAALTSASEQGASKAAKAAINSKFKKKVVGKAAGTAAALLI